MQSVTETPTSRKPTAFYAILHDVPGSLTKVDDDVLFFDPESGVITPVTSYVGLTVLGAIGLADTQQIMDQMHGGVARIACARLQEVA
jgi:hypothetical protein